MDQLYRIVPSDKLTEPGDRYFSSPENRIKAVPPESIGQECGAAIVLRPVTKEEIPASVSEEVMEQLAGLEKRIAAIGLELAVMLEQLPRGVEANNAQIS